MILLALSLTAASAHRQPDLQVMNGAAF